MDMRLPPGLTAAEAPPPLRLLQRWSPPSASVQAEPPRHGLALLTRALRRLFLAR